MAVLIPIRLPFTSTSAPPELPGLIAASVWMKFSKVLMPRWLRPSALTMPPVTVWPTPNGLPIASTWSPTCSASELPSVIPCSAKKLVDFTLGSPSELVCQDGETDSEGIMTGDRGNAKGLHFLIRRPQFGPQLFACPTTNAKHLHLAA